MEFHFSGILLGVFVFLIIGVFHPLVIKGEYYLGTKSCWLFLVAGIISITASLFIQDIIWSCMLGVLGFSCLWSIKEVFEQKKRVERGLFPKNPKRKK